MTAVTPSEDEDGDDESDINRSAFLRVNNNGSPSAGSAAKQQAYMKRTFADKPRMELSLQMVKIECYYSLSLFLEVCAYLSILFVNISSSCLISTNLLRILYFSLFMLSNLLTFYCIINHLWIMHRCCQAMRFCKGCSRRRPPPPPPAVAAVRRR